MGWQKKTPPSRGMDTFFTWRNLSGSGSDPWRYHGIPWQHLATWPLQIFKVGPTGPKVLLEGWFLVSTGARASVPSRWQVSWWRLIARVSWARIASWKLEAAANMGKVKEYMTCDYDKCHAKQEWHALITSIQITGEFDTGLICGNHPNLANLHLLGPSHEENGCNLPICWTTFVIFVVCRDHPSSCSDEAAMWTSPCLEPGCGSCWAQLGCRKYMEISDWARLTSSILDIFRGVETDPVRFLGVHALTTHRWPINCFWDPTAWNSWRWELLVGGASGGASSNEQIPRMPMIPRNGGALLLSWRRKWCGFHKKEPAFWMQTMKHYETILTHFREKNIGLFDFMTSWLYGEKWPVTTLLFDRCFHHLQDAASSEQSLSATLPDRKLTAWSQQCER